jgi:hypothetical protein
MPAMMMPPVTMVAPSVMVSIICCDNDARRLRRRARNGDTADSDHSSNQ